MASQIYILKNQGKGLIENALVEKIEDTNFQENVLVDLSNKVDKVTGKSLILDTEIVRLAGLQNETTATIQAKRPLKTIQGQSLEGSGNIQIDGVTDHYQLSNIGTKTHTQLETDITNINNSIEGLATDIELNNAINSINDNIDLIVGAGTLTPFERPTDWLPISSLVTFGEQKIVGLHSVYNNQANVVTVNITTSSGQFRVNWGNGVETLHNSGTVAENNLNFTDYVGTDTLYFRQAIITVTAVSGNILGINLNTKHSLAGLPNGYTSGWLDLLISGSFVNSFGMLGVNIVHRQLFKVNFIGTNAITNATSMFQNCARLVQVDINTALVTSMASMFNGCTSLQTVPLFNTALVTSMASMFQSCVSLQTVPLFNTALVTTMANMFPSCVSLQTVPLFNTALVSNMAIMFQSCTSLQTVPLFNTALVTTMANMFQSCVSLQTVPLFNTALVSNIASMFNGCVSLQTVPLFNTALVTSMASMFNGCTSLQSIPNFQAHTSSTTVDYTNFVAGCVSLSYCGIIGVRNTISFANCKLDTANLVLIFDNLQTVTSKNITITGNIGVSGLTASDRLIATNKGWTIIG